MIGDTCEIPVRALRAAPVESIRATDLSDGFACPSASLVQTGAISRAAQRPIIGSSMLDLSSRQRPKVRKSIRRICQGSIKGRLRQPSVTYLGYRARFWTRLLESLNAELAHRTANPAAYQESAELTRCAGHIE